MMVPRRSVQRGLYADTARPATAPIASLAFAATIDDVLSVKGSRASGMDRVVDALCGHALEETG
jgi:UDP-N-acetylmuramyl pentapeptide synthase